MAESIMCALDFSVVYAAEDGTLLEYHGQLPAGATVRAALEASGILSIYPDWEFSRLNIGIYAQKASLDTVLHQNDRVEIYRPLKIDPREKRRVKVNSTRDKRKWRQNIQNTR